MKNNTGHKKTDGENKITWSTLPILCLNNWNTGTTKPVGENSHSNNVAYNYIDMYLYTKNQTTVKTILLK